MREEERGEYESADHLDILGAKQHLSSIHAIGKHPADKRQKNDWQLTEKKVQSKVKRVFGEVINQPALCELLDKGSNCGGARTQPHDAKVAVPEGSECAVQERRC